MADEKSGGGEYEMVIFVFGGFALLVALWFMTGGPARTDLRGIFLSPPAPLGEGGAYGPQIKAPANTQINQQ